MALVKVLERAGDWLSLVLFLQAVAATGLLQSTPAWWRDAAGNLAWVNLWFFEPGGGACPSGGRFAANAATVAGLAAGIELARAAGRAAELLLPAARWAQARPPALLRLPAPELLLALGSATGLALSASLALADGCGGAAVDGLAAAVLVALAALALALRVKVERGLSPLGFAPGDSGGAGPLSPGGGGGGGDLLCGLGRGDAAHLVRFQYDRECVAVAGGLGGGITDVAFEDASAAERAAFWARAFAGARPPGSARAVGRWLGPTPAGGRAGSDFAEEGLGVELEGVALDIGDVMALDFDIRKVGVAACHPCCPPPQRPLSAGVRVVGGR